MIDVIEKYYRERYNELVNSSMSRLDSRIYLAEEAVQEAFFRAIKYYKSYDTKSSLDSWFRSILFNCINLILSQERSRGVVDFQEDFIDVRECGELDYQGNTLDIELYLSKEKGRNAEIVRLYYLVGLKSIEIAEFINVKHNNVRLILYRFRQKMREFSD